MKDLIEPFATQWVPAACGDSRHGDDSGIEVIRKAGTQRPLFLAQTVRQQADDETTALVQQLDLDMPVYGVRGVAAHEELPRTIEALARRCIRQIRSVQPDGPYRLAGWSFGGTLAYEIAAQLIGEDREVEFLGLIDTICPTIMRDVRLDAALDRDVAQIAAQLHYAVQRLPIPVHLFSVTHATSHSLGKFVDPLTGWDSIVPRDRLRLIHMPGSAGATPDPSHLTALGRALADAIRDVGSGRSPRVTLLEPAYRPHVCVQTGRHGHVPVFCVPGAGSSVTDFTAWAQAVGEEWPVHGLQPRGVSDGLVPHSTVQAAAGQYLRAVNEVHPHGPVHLIGHSFGGWVVLELAHRLRAHGRSVASLTIIDTEVPDDQDQLFREYTAVEGLAELMGLIAMSVEKPLGIEPADLIPLDDVHRLRLLHQAFVKVGVMPMRSSPNVLSGVVRTLGAALRTTYRPAATYSDTLRLVTVRDTRIDANADERRCEEQVRGWRRWAPRLSSWHGPGNHMTVLTPPHVMRVAEWWRGGAETTRRSSQERKVAQS